MSPRNGTAETARLIPQDSRQESYASIPTDVETVAGSDDGVTKQQDGLNQYGHYNLIGITQRSFWVIFGSISACMFLCAFDATVVATLTGPISSSFKATNLSSWIGTTYMLVLCCLTPIYGRLCNIIGRQASMLIALFFFTLGNGLCAVAPNMLSLIAARGIAGFGGGGLQTVSSTMISDIVPVSHRALFQGYMNIAFGIGTASGAPIGGLISDWIGWRYVFMLQVPLLCIGMLLIYLNVRYSPPGLDNSSKESTMDKIKRIDFVGVLLLATWQGLGLVALSLKTNSTEDVKWSDPLIWGMLVGSGVGLVLFVVYEHHVKEPVLPLELLKMRTAVAVAANNFFSSIAIFANASLLFSAPLFFQAVRLLSAAQSGYLMAPLSFAGMVGSVSTGFLVRSTGRYWVLTAVAAAVTMIGPLAATIWDVETPTWILWVPGMFMMLGGASISTTTIVALIAEVGPEHVALATSLSYLFRSVGQVLGVALSGALTQAVLTKELTSRITGPNAAEIIKQVRESSSGIKYLPPLIKAAAIASWQKALHAVFVGVFILFVLAGLAAVGIRDLDLKALAKKKAEEIENRRNQAEDRQAP